MTRKLKILTEASKLFNSKGIVDTSIQEIAKLSECSVGAVYLDFPSKSVIVRKAIENNLCELSLDLLVGKDVSK